MIQELCGKDGKAATHCVEHSFEGCSLELGMSVVFRGVVRLVPRKRTLCGPLSEWAPCSIVPGPCGHLHLIFREAVGLLNLYVICHSEVSSLLVAVLKKDRLAVRFHFDARPEQSLMNSIRVACEVLIGGLDVVEEVSQVLLYQ